MKKEAGTQKRSGWLFAEVIYSCCAAYCQDCWLASLGRCDAYFVQPCAVYRAPYLQTPSCFPSLSPPLFTSYRYLAQSACLSYPKNNYNCVRAHTFNGIPADILGL
jgi:hypothetical protein